MNSRQLLCAGNATFGLDKTYAVSYNTTHEKVRSEALASLCVRIRIHPHALGHDCLVD
jgi:hypothetical protein